MTDPTSHDPDSLEKLGIASALIKARSEVGMTQAQLAEESGISRSAIKGYETGRNMPGARELKALCRVLKLSPNVLLFGVDEPFKDARGLAIAGNPGLGLFLGDEEGAAKARMRIAVLASLLTTDEVASVLHILQALAVARHGIEVVEQHLVGADLMTGMGQVMKKNVDRHVSGESPMTGDEVTEGLEDFMTRQGHKPKG